MDIKTLENVLGRIEHELINAEIVADTITEPRNVGIVHGLMKAQKAVWIMLEMEKMKSSVMSQTDD